MTLFYLFFFATIFKDQRLFLSLTTHEIPIDELKSRWAVFFHSGITYSYTRHASIIITDILQRFPTRTSLTTRLPRCLFND